MRQVIGRSADEVGQRIAIVMSLAQEDAVGAQAGLHESGVLDEDAVQADDVVEGERVCAGRLDRAGPALEPVARRALVLDREAGAAVCEEQDTGGARDERRGGPRRW
jgi:hypothetical protein